MTSGWLLISGGCEVIPYLTLASRAHHLRCQSQASDLVEARECMVLASNTQPSSSPFPSTTQLCHRFASRHTRLTRATREYKRPLHRASRTRTHRTKAQPTAAHRPRLAPTVAFRATPRIASHSPPTLLPPPRVTISSGTARPQRAREAEARSRAGGSTRQTKAPPVWPPSRVLEVAPSPSAAAWWSHDGSMPEQRQQ